MTPTVKTSYFAKWKELEESGIYQPISVAQYNPKSMGCIPWLATLAPTPELLRAYKHGELDEKSYTMAYKTSLLRLNKEAVLEQIMFCAKGKIPVLVCYEKPSDFCHRHILAEWLTGSRQEIELPDVQATFQFPENLPEE